jgi:hypothetical protein
MPGEAQALARLKRIREDLDRISGVQAKLLDLGEELLIAQRHLLESQETGNLLAWLQLQQAQGIGPDPVVVGIVRERLRL